MNREQLIQELLVRFRSVFHRVKSGIRFPHSSHDLSGSEIAIMMRLGQRSTGISMKELAAELSMTSGGVTQLVDKLVEKALVERAEDPADRRSVLLTPSATASAMHDNLRQQFQIRMAAAFQGLTNDEIETLIELLKKVSLDHA